MEYICEKCNKQYKSYQSLWNHNKKFHKFNLLKNPQKIEEIPHISSKITQNIKSFICCHCHREYSRNDNLKRHITMCKLKINNDKLFEENKNKLEEQGKVIEELKAQLLLLMNKQCKIHPNTLKKINNQLNNSNINSNVNSNNIINNNTINIIALGHEELQELLSKKQKIAILDKKYNSLNYLVKYIHFNKKYPQFRNILITNTQNNVAYKYDGNEQKFIAIEKNVLLNDLILERMSDIEEFYEEVGEELKERTKNIIDKFIQKMDSNEAYKEQKKKEIKFIIYNNKDMVSKDLEIVL
jgi:hypothetical protein